MTLQLSREDFEFKDIDDQEEKCPLHGRAVLCSKWLMFWRDDPIPVRMTAAEGRSLLLLASNGSFPMGAPLITASRKIRQALSKGEPEADIEISCTDVEARFLRRSRLA